MMSVEAMAKTAENLAKKTDEVERQKREVSRAEQYLKQHATDVASLDLQQKAQKLAQLEHERDALERDFNKLK